ncbi:1-aminocyclopropane-1-carboxylate synthase [Striga asiatica]|uniref:1-aminocyclopropane-1-carboxylate synthase n=1 Tax=Striga asiatica TaxID=4170 RepID=A0A5A7NZW2_STRAF|nr:1-aminocyclopropane-1-carboxylate synthase [Striga asiatica]
MLLIFKECAGCSRFHVTSNGETTAFQPCTDGEILICFSPHQRLITSMLSDMKFIRENVVLRRERPKRVYVEFGGGLKVGIECIRCSGGFHCLADMNGLFRSYSEKGELQLWENLSTVAKINALSGSSCHCVEPGLFGFYFATLCEKDRPLVVQCIKKVLKGFIFILCFLNLRVSHLWLRFHI